MGFLRGLGEVLERCLDVLERSWKGFQRFGICLGRFLVAWRSLRGLLKGFKKGFESGRRGP